LTTINDARNDLLFFKGDYQNCLTLEHWISNELEKACQDDKTELMTKLGEVEGRLTMAGNDQTPLLDYLYPFKKIHEEIRDSDDAQIIDFGDRLKQDFLDTITHRVSAMVEIPATPSQCGDVDS
jgi:hypothetical protein